MSGEHPMRYGFGTTDDACKVECPELEAFLGDLIAVCERHGVVPALEESWHNDELMLVLQPFTAKDAVGLIDALTENLEDARGPDWLLAAKERCEENKRMRDAVDAAERRLLARARQHAEERALLAQGIVVAGKHYRLVED